MKGKKLRDGKTSKEKYYYFLWFFVFLLVLMNLFRFPKMQMTSYKIINLSFAYLVCTTLLGYELCFNVFKRKITAVLSIHLSQIFGLCVLLMVLLNGWIPFPENWSAAFEFVVAFGGGLAFNFLGFYLGKKFDR